MKALKVIAVLVSIVMGGVFGAAIALSAQYPIAETLGISNFEGGQSYFGLLVLMPLYGVIGAATAGLTTGLLVTRPEE